MRNKFLVLLNSDCASNAYTDRRGRRHCNSRSQNDNKLRRVAIKRRDLLKQLLEIAYLRDADGFVGSD